MISNPTQVTVGPLGTRGLKLNSTLERTVWLWPQGGEKGSLLQEHPGLFPGSCAQPWPEAQRPLPAGLEGEVGPGLQSQPQAPRPSQKPHCEGPSPRNQGILCTRGVCEGGRKAARAHTTEGPSSKNMAVFKCPPFQGREFCHREVLGGRSALRGAGPKGRGGVG